MRIKRTKYLQGYESILSNLCSETQYILYEMSHRTGWSVCHFGESQLLYGQYAVKPLNEGLLSKGNSLIRKTFSRITSLSTSWPCFSYKEIRL